MHLLKVKILDDCPNRETVLAYYSELINKTSYEKDCGVDIIFPEPIRLEVHRVTMCNMGIACEFIPDGSPNGDSGAFDLVGRSSISKTPLSLANAIGIFDPTYRGPVIAALRCHPDRAHPTTIDGDEKGIYYEAGTNKDNTRLVQIVAPDRKPIKVIVVDDITKTERGVRGFGSTN